MVKTKRLRLLAALIVMLLGINLYLMFPEMNADAATPAYVTWRQTDSRWGTILLNDSNSEATVADYGCAATSITMLLAHSGVCSEDESVFNPKIGITKMKSVGAFSTSGAITWSAVTKAYSNFKYNDVITLSGTKAEKISTIQSYYKKGYYMVVSVDTRGGSSTNHWVAVRTLTTDSVVIMDPGGKNYTDLSKYSITNRIILYSAPNPCTWRDAAALSSISVATAPATRIYENGSAFNPAGMVIKAAYSDGTSKNVTGYKTSYDFSSAGNKNVTISYTENGVTKSTTQAVIVMDVFSGSGTDADPYQINNKSELLAMMNMVNNVTANGCYGTASYIQTADIEVDEMPEPIGSFYENSSSTTITSYAAFNGHYNGNYHKLTNFIINNNRLYTGVFGRINKNAVIENLSVSGTVTGESSCVGGIVGEQGYGSIVRNCDFSGTVTGNSLVGGISGKIQGGGTVSSCYANAEVAAEKIAGGIVGYALVGNKTSSVDFLCESSYFAGTVSGSQTGGVCGGTEIKTTKECTVTFSKAYYLNTAAGGAVNGADTTGCAGVYASTLKNMASGLGDVFVNSTEAVNDGYPVFVWQTPSPFAGSGTAADPYQISSKKDLENMRDLVNNTMTNKVYGFAYYIQTADIDLENENWIPIGSYYENDTSTVETKEAAFNGNYNGNCHTIKNLYVNTTRCYGGLFGRGNSTCFIYDLAVEGNVSSGKNFTGGVIGAVCWGAKVQGCSFNGTVTSLYNTGGITGIIHQGGSVVDCYANAEVTATDSTYGYAGGITGYARTGSDDPTCMSVEISNCYFAGKTNGKARNGGISCGVESLSGTYQPQFIVDNCYYASTASSGAVNSAAYSGCIGMSENQLKLLAESLGSAYADNTSEDVNNGYPVFVWQVKALRGDVNLDGEVDVTDIVILQQYLTRKVFVNDDEYIVDVNEDGTVNVFDSITLKRILL